MRVFCGVYKHTLPIKASSKKQNYPIFIQTTKPHIQNKRMVKPIFFMPQYVYDCMYKYTVF